MPTQREYLTPIEQLPEVIFTFKDRWYTVTSCIWLFCALYLTFILQSHYEWNTSITVLILNNSKWLIRKELGINTFDSLFSFRYDLSYLSIWKGLSILFYAYSALRKLSIMIVVDPICLFLFYQTELQIVKHFKIWQNCFCCCNQTAFLSLFPNSN